MLKFFPKKEAVRDEVFEEVQNFATAAAAKQLKEARRKRGETPWASWPPQKKQALAEELASGLSWSAFKVLCVRVFLHLVGAFPLQLRHAEEEMPPESTLRGWRAKAKYGRVLLAPGRPSTLSTLEETVVMDTMRFLRKNGVVVDRELLALVGRKAMAAARSQPFESLAELPMSWVKSFRKRHRLSRFARSSIR